MSQRKEQWGARIILLLIAVILLGGSGLGFDAIQMNGRRRIWPFPWHFHRFLPLFLLGCVDVLAFFALVIGIIGFCLVVSDLWKKAWK